MHDFHKGTPKKDRCMIFTASYYLPLSFLLCLFLITTPAVAQNNSTSPDSAIVVAGAEYEAGGLYKFILGPLWRNAWTTPVKVPFLDMATFDDGLTAIRRGGGRQTKSLRLMSGNGTEWKFRSVNKDPKDVLPEDVQKSIVTDFAQDQIATSFPYAPIVVAPLLDAVKMIHPAPYLCIMPDDERLGEFREEFANMLGMIEVHPDEGKDDKPGFEGSEKVIGSFKFFERLADDRNEEPEMTEYLKARLMDFVIGDWDRHADQWRWARFEEGKRNYWIAIPRDRDRAFSKFDGIIPSITTLIVPQWKHFDYDYPNIIDLTWSGRFVDRRILSELQKDDWDSVAVSVASAITDSVIDLAVNRMPPEIYELAADEIRSKLISRRDKIPAIAKEFYNLINEIPEIYCSNKDDYVSIKRGTDDITVVTVYKRDKKDGGIKDADEPLYQKAFYNKITKEIRIFLLDGDDKVTIAGEVDDGPVIKIVDLDGKDEYVDYSKVNGWLLGFLPIPEAESINVIYDSGKKAKITPGPSTRHVDDKWHEPETELEKYEPLQRQRGTDLVINPIVEYSSQNGMQIGGGPAWFHYNFRKVPYDYYLTFTGSYATDPSSYSAAFEGIFNSIFHGATVRFEAERTGLSFTNYLGYGNETSYDDDLSENEYYDLKQIYFRAASSIDFYPFDNTVLNVGASIERSHIELNTESLLNNFPRGKYGLETHAIAGAHTKVTYDSRDHIYNAFKGLFLELSSSVYPGILDNRQAFTKAAFDVRTYFTSEFITHSTLALRMGGEKVWGNYPFHHASFLGGRYNLRGYKRDRFSGDASLFGQIELRANVTRLKVLIFGIFGLHGFAETGRVWVNGEDSGLWHQSYGGGFYMTFLERMFNISFTVGTSHEYTAYYVRTKLSF